MHQTIIGTMGLELDYSIELNSTGDGILHFLVEDQFSFDSFEVFTDNTLESIETAYLKALNYFHQKIQPENRH